MALRRAIVPMFPSVLKLEQDARPTLCLQTTVGTFWLPCQFDRATGRVWATLVPDQHFHFTGVLVVDFENYVIARPIDFKLPHEVFGRESTDLEWRVRV